MGLFSKPKGKHAQKPGVQPTVIRPEGASETEQDVEAVASAETAVPEAAPAPVADEPTIRIEDFVQGASGSEPSPAPAPVSAPAAMAGVDAHDGSDVYSGYGYDAASPTPVLPEGFAVRKERHVGKIVGIVFGVIIGILLIAYIAGAIVFMNFFFPRTSIVGNDISMMGNDEVVQLIEEKVADYTIDVVGNGGFSYRTTAADVDLEVDAQAVVDTMHADLNPWTWPVLLFQDEHDESSALAVTYKKQNYDYQVVNAVTAYNKDATAPVDATIAYDEASKKFKIVPEVAGTQYDSHVILAAMEDAFATLEPKVKLTSDFLVQPNVFSTDERLVNSAELATGLVSAHVTLTMGGQNVAEIDGNNLSAFIRMDENMGVTLDEAALDQWVTDLSNGFDTVGSERTYTRPDGKVITVSGGAYGWSTDAPGLKDQVVAAVKSGETTTIDIPCEQYAATYNGKGQPDWGNRYIDVDLSEQYVRFYGDDGSLIWESACVSGSPDGEHNTWPGVWYITNKESPSKLIGYLPNGQKEYETTVSFWMAFEGNGIGLHDATWQPSFGGSMYANGYGSHGCVNLPYGAAESLYSMTSVGDVVIAHY
ncbi:MAG: L,D-transpeptidase/peptidoglycan binding protein [Eggerthellaceae bacterium]|nr:L,D-transpeptidase/peptidoglycan binding protein [Eggerthellaceae bacterium]